MIEKNHDKAAAVDRSYHWIPVDENTPRGCKLQLINRRDGVAHYGQLLSGNKHWTHWAPLPTFLKAKDAEIKFDAAKAELLEKFDENMARMMTPISTDRLLGAPAPTPQPVDPSDFDDSGFGFGLPG